VKLGWRLGRYEALTMAVAREVAVAGRGSSGAAGKQGALLTAVDQICVTEGEGPMNATLFPGDGDDACDVVLAG
jgi:hypothetical protein